MAAATAEMPAFIHSSASSVQSVNTRAIRLGTPCTMYAIPHLWVVVLSGGAQIVAQLHTGPPASVWSTSLIHTFAERCRVSTLRAKPRTVTFDRVVVATVGVGELSVLVLLSNATRPPALPLHSPSQCADNMSAAGLCIAAEAIASSFADAIQGGRACSQSGDDRDMAVAASILPIETILAASGEQALRICVAQSRFRIQQLVLNSRCFLNPGWAAGGDLIISPDDGMCSEDVGISLAEAVSTPTPLDTVAVAVCSDSSTAQSPAASHSLGERAGALSSVAELADSVMDCMETAFGPDGGCGDTSASLAASLATSSATQAASTASVDLLLLSQHALAAMPTAAKQRRSRAEAWIDDRPSHRPRLPTAATPGSRKHSGFEEHKTAAPGSQASSRGVERDVEAAAPESAIPYGHHASKSGTPPSELAQVAPLRVSVLLEPARAGPGDGPPVAGLRFERIVPVACSSGEGLSSLCASVQLSCTDSDEAACAVGRLIQDTASALRLLQGAGRVWATSLKPGTLSGLVATPIAASRPSTAPAMPGSKVQLFGAQTVVQHIDGSCVAVTVATEEQVEAAAPVWGAVVPTDQEWSDSDEDSESKTA